jgi:hypothetical protein
MKKFISTTLMIVMFTALAFSQNLKQTVRGTIVDADSKLPLNGVTIVILDTDPMVGTTTDLNGIFRFKNIPIGRIAVKISYIGYETKTISDIVVNSGKEVVLDFSMQESVIKIDEAVVRAYKNKGEATNDMSQLSLHSITLEETKRFTGGSSQYARWKQRYYCTGKFTQIHAMAFGWIRNFKSVPYG